MSASIMSDTSRNLIVSTRKMMISNFDDRDFSMRNEIFLLQGLRLLRIKFTCNDLTYMDYRRRAVSS